MASKRNVASQSVDDIMARLERGKKRAVARAAPIQPSNRAARINELHSEAQASAKTAVEKAVACGKELIEAKKECKHGEWLNWLANNVTFTERQAQNYMKAAKNPNALECDTMREAAGLIDSPKCATVSYLDSPQKDEAPPSPKKRPPATPDPPAKPQKEPLPIDPQEPEPPERCPHCGQEMPD